MAREDPQARRKIDYGRASEQPRPLSQYQYTGSGMEGLEQGEPAAPIRKAGSFDRSIIATVAGCIFLVIAFTAAIICIQCIWTGVFPSNIDHTDAQKQEQLYRVLGGFAASALVAFVAGWAGWRFLYKN